MKVLIACHHRFELWNAPEWVAVRMRREFRQLEVVDLPDYERVAGEIADAEVFVGWSLRPEQFLAARKLRWIYSPAAAVHQLMIPEIVASPVIITNARDVHGPVVAEHALALLLALAKRLPSAVRYQQKRIWGQEALWSESLRPREVAGATLGLIGLGGIGRALAPQAAALGMRVLAVREHPELGRSDIAGVSEVYGPAELESVLAQSDFVVLAAPLTHATRGLMNAARLSKMKREAYLINISRGPLIDDDALIAALQEKKIAGVALDVFATEPLPPESPYWSLENVLITPHTAAVTEKLWERHYALIRENLERDLAHQPLRNVVDKSKGY